MIWLISPAYINPAEGKSRIKISMFVRLGMHDRHQICELVDGVI